MRISDWSSDVCSSDLAQDPLGQDHAPHPAQDRRERARPAWGYQHAGRPGGGGFAGEAAAGAWLRQVRPGGQRRAVSCQPLSCAAGEGGAKRRVRARLLKYPGKRKPALRRVFFKSLRSEEHTSELQSLMRTSYAVFCLKQKHQKSHNERII